MESVQRNRTEKTNDDSVLTVTHFICYNQYELVLKHIKKINITAPILSSNSSQALLTSSLSLRLKCTTIENSTDQPQRPTPWPIFLYTRLILAVTGLLSLAGLHLSQ